MLKKRNSGLLKSWLVITVMAFYLLIASSHVFFLPRLTQLPSTHSTAFNSVFKRKTESVRRSFNESSYVQRPDKSTLEEKKSVIDLITAVLSSFILLFFVLRLRKLSISSFFEDLRLSFAHHYIYLSLCTFRI